MTGRTQQEVELLLRILSDVRPSVPAEGAYLFAETESNQDSVCAAARELLDRRLAERILISDCTPKSGYAGAAACRQALIEGSLPAGSIREVPMEPTEILHTRLEAEAVVRVARAPAYHPRLGTAVPFHQERAFRAVVTAALQEYPSLKIYSYPGAPQPWDEVVTHSQGWLRGTRAALIAEEQKRIEKYTTEGNLTPCARILEYLRLRDR
jgi:hypothetical protein